MATKEEEAMQRAVLGRVADGTAEMLRAIDGVESRLTVIETKQDAILAKQVEQGPIVAQFGASIQAELTEVARIKAEKVAGKSALLSLVADARVMAVVVSLVTAICVSILSYFGVLPHATN